MNLLPTSEQLEAVQAVSGFLAIKLPVTRYHRFPYTQLDTPGAALGEVAELGLFGYGLEEAKGGSGGTLMDEMLVFREVGRVVGPLWILGGTIGARIAALAGERGVLADILGGKAAVCVAGRGSDESLQLFAVSGARYAAVADERGALLLDCQKLSPRSLPCIERQLALAEAPLNPSAVVASAPGPDLAQRATVLLAAMQVGGAEAARDMAVAYAKLREQFGRPIGSFQAISHMCADMAVRCEEAGAQLAYASLCVNGGLPQARFELHAAAALSMRAAIENARANIQVHGAIAMNEAHEAHYYVKRSHVLETLLGGSTHHLEALIGAERL